MVDKEKLSDKVTFEQSPGESESTGQSSGENNKCKAPEGMACLAWGGQSNTQEEKEVRK